MTEELRSALVWTGYFLLLELPSHFGWIPNYTLSRTVWGGIAWWHPLADAVVVFAVVLVAHLLWRISAAALIGLAIAIALAVVLHWRGALT